MLFSRGKLAILARDPPWSIVALDVSALRSSNKAEGRCIFGGLKLGRVGRGPAKVCSVMVFDEDDPAWLAACIAAVDSLPEANLPGSILNCSTSASPRSNTSNNTSTAATAHSSGNGRPASCSSFGLPSGEICSETSRGSAASYSTTARDGVEGDPHSLVHPSRTARGASESRAKLGHRRLQGVGINVRRHHLEQLHTVSIYIC